MTADYWQNGQLSIARNSGEIKINGDTYLVIGDNLIHKDWLPVYSVLGEEGTFGLIRNGTTLEVAKKMAEEVKEMRRMMQSNQLKLNL
jgi:hypothetical protein